MHVVIVAWMYVVLMMSVAEAMSPRGTVLGAIVTFVLYGVLPLAIVVYILDTPRRKRRRRALEAEQFPSPAQDDGGSHAPAAEPVAGVAPEREQR